MMRNKKADVAATLLVFMAFGLMLAASFIFISDSGKLKDKIADSRFVDEVYLKEEKIDFYVNEIMEKAVAGVSSEGDEEKFVQNFKQELERYKEGEYVLDELVQVERQINGYKERGSVKIENSKIKAEFVIRVGSGLKEDKFNAVHTYSKTFEKEI